MRVAYQKDKVIHGWQIVNLLLEFGGNWQFARDSL